MNVVIENKNQETWIKIKEYFESKGVSTDRCSGKATEEDGYSYRYYGLINGRFSCYDIECVEEAGAKIITLPEYKRGDMVMVWDDDEKDAAPCLYLTTIEGAKFPIMAVSMEYEEEYHAGEPFHAVGYKNIKPIEEKEVHLTLKDISEGKGVGVPSHLIRIKDDM